MSLLKPLSILISSPKFIPRKCCTNPKRATRLRPGVFFRISSNFGGSSAIAANAGVETAAVAEKPAESDFKVFDGMPEPFGAVARDGGVNFAIYSSGASAAALCLFSLSDLKENRVTKQVHLDPLTNKTGNIWHVFLEGRFEGMLYGYKFDGKFSSEEGHYFHVSRVLLDPYAKTVIGRGEYGVPGPGGNCWPQMAGMVPLPENKISPIRMGSTTAHEKAPQKTSRSFMTGGQTDMKFALAKKKTSNLLVPKFLPR